MNSTVLLMQLIKKTKENKNKDVITNLNGLPTFLPKMPCPKCKPPKEEKDDRSN